MLASHHSTHATHGPGAGHQPSHVPSYLAHAIPRSRGSFGNLAHTPRSETQSSRHRHSDSYSSLLFELELEDACEATGSAQRVSVDPVLLELTACEDGAAQELWEQAIAAKQQLEDHDDELHISKSSATSVDVAIFAELLASAGFQVWLRRGTYTCPAELGLSHIRHTFVVVSLSSDSSQPAYYVVDPNYKEHFQLGGSGTSEYQDLLDRLPSVFVGGAEQWMALVNLLCKEMERVFFARGLPLPPWRFPEIMKGHWLVNQADDVQVSPSASTMGSRLASADLTSLSPSGMVPVYGTDRNGSSSSLALPSTATTSCAPSSSSSPEPPEVEAVEASHYVPAPTPAIPMPVFM